MQIILQTPLMHYRHLAGLHPKEYIPQLRCKENKEKVKRKKEKEGSSLIIFTFLKTMKWLILRVLLLGT